MTEQILKALDEADIDRDLAIYAKTVYKDTEEETDEETQN
jgi:hypothetical protein